MLKLCKTFIKHLTKKLLMLLYIVISLLCSLSTVYYNSYHNFPNSDWPTLPTLDFLLVQLTSVL